MSENNQVLQKKIYKIVVLIRGIEFAKSTRLIIANKIYFFYPTNYFEKINILKKDLKETRDIDLTNYSTVEIPPLNYFNCGKDFTSYLILDEIIELNESIESIFDKLYIELKNIFKIISFLTETFIEMENVLIYEEISNIYKLKRGIVIRNYTKDEYKHKRTFKYENFASNIKEIYESMVSNDNMEYIECFAELLNSISSPTIEIKTMNLWNYLEHITSIYAKKNGINLLINKEKHDVLIEDLKAKIQEICSNPDLSVYIDISQLKEKLNAAVNSTIIVNETNFPNDFKREIKDSIRASILSILNNEDILTPPYNKAKLPEKFIQIFQNNFPFIKDLIFFILNKENFKCKDNEENIIQYMYIARNHYFHESINSEELFSKIENEISTKEHLEVKVDYQYLYQKIIMKFQKFLENLTFHLIKVPNIKESSSSFNISFQNYLPNIHKMDKKTYFEQIFYELLNTISAENQYNSIIHLTTNIIDNFKKIFYNVEYGGLNFQSDAEKQDASYIIKDDFKGLLDCSNIKFQSNATKDFDSIIYLKKHKGALNSLLHFDGRFSSFNFLSNFDSEKKKEFEYFSLDFWIDAELNAKNKPDLYKSIKDSVSPLPIDFLNEKYYKERYYIPDDFKKKLNPLMDVNLINFPVILIKPNKFSIQRFKNIIEIDNIHVKKIDKYFYIYFNRFLGIDSKDSSKSIWTAQESVKLHESEPSFYYFPFKNREGLVIICNSDELFALNIFLYCERNRILKELGRYFMIFQFYILELIKIETNVPIIEKDLIKLRSLKDQQELSINIDNNPDLINKFRYYQSEFIQLLTSISIFPRCKEFQQVKMMKTELKKEISSLNEKENLKGTMWLLNLLERILYFFIFEEVSIFFTVNNTEKDVLLKICEQINGKSITERFFDDLSEFCLNYIDKNIANSNQ